jgi:chromosome segregation ATPase
MNKKKEPTKVKKQPNKKGNPKKRNSKKRKLKKPKPLLEDNWDKVSKKIEDHRKKQRERQAITHIQINFIDVEMRKVARLIEGQQQKMKGENKRGSLKQDLSKVPPEHKKNVKKEIKKNKNRYEKEKEQNQNKTKKDIEILKERKGSLKSTRALLMKYLQKSTKQLKKLEELMENVKKSAEKVDKEVNRVTDERARIFFHRLWNVQGFDEEFNKELNRIIKLDETKHDRKEKLFQNTGIEMK